MTMQSVLVGVLAALLLAPVSAQVRRDVTYKIFQFPAAQIPRVDGKTQDWSMVPDSYAIGTDQLMDTLRGRGMNHDLKDLDVKVKVGWVKGLNRLYFLYEATDNFWNVSANDLHNDIFEVVVDGDMSGGPLIDAYHPAVWTPEMVGAARAVRDPRIDEATAHWMTHGVHAQNYHIFTPPGDKDWTMAWGCAQYIKDLPYANAAYDTAVKAGEGGKLTLEFWITPFDYAPCDGPQRAVESLLTENKLIGLSWSVIDYDAETGPQSGFWNLSHKHTMYGNASELVGFRLMPIEPSLLPTLQAQWSYVVADMARRLVQFRDESIGQVTAWKWDFGDNTTSTEQHPSHAYRAGRDYTVSLEVTSATGTSRKVKVWNVAVR
ncbi:MAG: PKD domain-containing protein [Vicinamibacterales bacterium]